MSAFFEKSDNLLFDILSLLDFNWYLNPECLSDLLELIDGHIIHNDTW